MSKNVKRVRLLVLSLITILTSTVHAQETVRVHVDTIDNDQFPFLEVYTAVTNVQGKPINNLNQADFKVYEDEKPVLDFEVTPIQNKSQAVAVVLLIDTSGSMAPTTNSSPLQDSIDAAKSFVEALSPQDQVAIVSFSDAPNVVSEFTNNEGFINNALETLKPGGNTVLYDGIVQAVNLLRNRSERQIVVLITDGVDSSTGSFGLDASIDEAQDWGIPIYPVGFGNVDRKALERIALSTGGFSQIAPDSSELSSALSTVLQIFREQYLIRYDSSLMADGLNHELEVVVNGVSSKTKFIALPLEITIELPFDDGDVIGGNILLKPEVLSPAPLSQLDIMIDGKPLQTVLSAPFEYEWDSTTITPGEHEFTFIVKDTAGNDIERSVTLNIQPPITLDILIPKNEKDLTGSSSVSVIVSSLSAIASVEYFIDGNPIRVVDKPPYEIVVNWDTYSKGIHLLKVKATDVNGFVETKEIYVQTKGIEIIWYLVIVVVFGVTALAIIYGLRKIKQSVETPVKAGQAVLRELKGTEVGRVWELLPRDMGVGRKSSNYIKLNSTKASREQAVIRYENGKYILYNMKSDNPPLVNNASVYTKQELKTNDILQFGEEVLRYEQH